MIMINTAIQSGLVFDHFTDTNLSLPPKLLPERFSGFKKEYTFFLLHEGKLPKSVAKMLRKNHSKHLFAKSVSFNTEEIKNIKTDVYVYQQDYTLKVFLFCRFKDDFDALREAKQLACNERISCKHKKVPNINYDTILGIGA